MLMFIHVAGDPSDRVFSLRDFDRTFDDLVEYFQSNPDQLARSVKRVLRLKRRVHGSFEPEDWRVNVDAVASVLRQPEHLHLARRAAAESITLINDESALFGEGRGPLSNIDADQPLTIVAPVFARDDLTPQSSTNSSSPKGTATDTAHSGCGMERWARWKSKRRPRRSSRRARTLKS